LSFSWQTVQQVHKHKCNFIEDQERSCSIFQMSAGVLILKVVITEKCMTVIQDRQLHDSMAYSKISDKEIKYAPLEMLQILSEDS